MDFDKAKRRQSLKVIISEIVMVMTVIATVIILAFIVSGYWINEDFKVERQGMLQISSIPTGADVIIDDESSWLQKTNTSKLLSSGEHTITLTKDGYDSWSKTINISEGLLYRLRYPRLFPIQRKKEIIYDTLGVTQVFVSSDREKMLLYSGDPTTLDMASLSAVPSSATDPSTTIPDWALLELTSDSPEPKPVDYRVLHNFFKQPEPNDNSNLLRDFHLNNTLTGSEELIFSKFYDDYYLTVIDGTTATLYKKGADEQIVSSELAFVPTDTTVSRDGEFIVLSSSSQIATLDMEVMSVTQWSVEGGSFGWLDDNLIYTVSDGELIVYDFDGLNRRVIATNVSSHFPATITSEKWLYYFSDDELIREQLIK